MNFLYEISVCLFWKSLHLCNRKGIFFIVFVSKIFIDKS